MESLKFSSTKAASVKESFTNLKQDLQSAITKINTFKGEANSYANTWVSTYLDRFFDAPNRDDYENYDAYKEDYDSFKSSAEKTINAQAESYKSTAKYMESYVPNVKTTVETMSNAFDKLVQAIETFEGTPTSISELLSGIEGISTVVVGEGDEATEVVYYTYKDPDTGEEITLTISELVNAFYTYTGSTLNAIVAAQMIGDAQGYDEATVNQMLIDAVGSSNAYVDNLSKDGFMTVATTNDIGNLYTAVTGETYNEETMNTQYQSMLTSLNEKHEGLNAEELFGSDIGAMAATLGCALAPGLMGSGAFNLTDNLNEYNAIHKKADSEEEEEEKNETPAVADNKENVSQTPSEQQPQQVIPETPVEQVQPDPIVEEVIQLEPEQETPVEETITEPVEEPVQEEVYVPEFVEPVQTELPKEIEQINEISADEVDAEATEAYYEKYGDDLAAHRAEESAKFEELFMKEDKTELIETFEEMGYSHEDAVVAANNRDVGLSAYMLGSQNSETAKIAAEIANANDIDNFDTTFDDTPNIEDLTNGNSVAQMSDPMESPKVVEAKEAYVEAKDAYIESVDTANESIKVANEAKDNLSEVVKEVQAEAGTDTSKWSKAQVDKVNKAMKTYNVAVTQANNDVKTSETIKTTYHQAKADYLEAKNDYYQEQINQYLENNNTNNTNNNNNINNNTNGTLPNTNTDTDVSADDFLGVLGGSDGNISVS